jgi:hypothetical protein
LTRPDCLFTLMAAETDKSYIIEPLDPSRHERAGFSCGVAQVDNFLQKTANKLSQADNLRVYVMTEDGRSIIGLSAINSHAIDYRDLPPKFTRTRPGHGMIPTAFISMTGRDSCVGDQGIGGDLLVDCLLRIARLADEICLAVVLLDVLDCGDAARSARRAALYASYGFIPLASNPSHMLLPVATIRATLE